MTDDNKDKQGQGQSRQARQARQGRQGRQSRKAWNAGQVSDTGEAAKRGKRLKQAPQTLPNWGMHPQHLKEQAGHFRLTQAGWLNKQEHNQLPAYQGIIFVWT